VLAGESNPPSLQVTAQTIKSSRLCYYRSGLDFLDSTLLRRLHTPGRTLFFGSPDKVLRFVHVATQMTPYGRAGARDFMTQWRWILEATR
jgi:hypothetical protein